MGRTETITEAIFGAIDEVNATMDSERTIAKSRETVVFGAESPLDSLALITLLTAIEERIEQQSGETLSLMDLLPTDGQSVTVGSLARSICDSQSSRN